MWSPIKATLTNPRFQYFSAGWSTAKHKKPNFEYEDKLKNCVQIWVSLLKIKGIYINKAGHILNLMDEIFLVFFTKNE